MGFIYILKNNSMPNLVKIGYTDATPKERLQSINAATGVPEKFSIIYERKIESAQKIESKIHTTLHKFRFKTNKEFFVLTEKLAIEYVDAIIEDVYRGVMVDERVHTTISDSIHLGRMIRNKRKQQGLTIEDLSIIANVGERCIGELERGKPTVQIQKIFDVLTSLNIPLIMGK